MSRNAVPIDFAEESFARLLEHLTRSRSETPVAESIPTAGARPGQRALLPMTELKNGRANGTADSMPLSYEKALRLHARRTPVVSASRDLPEHPLPGAGPRQDRTTRKDLGVKAGKSFPKSQSAAQTTLDPKVSATSLSSPSNTRARIEAPAQPRTKPAAKSSSQTQTRPQSRPESRSKSRSKSQSKKSSADREPLKNSQGPARTAQPRKGSDPVKLARRDLQWNPIGTFDQLEQVAQLAPFDQPAQRRSIVSLRLTDGEFLQLKDRANESGISVSAYMRSCIVDADQLRAQVKQALAEMRALNARPEPNRLPALPSPAASSSGKRRDWFRLLAQSAVFLLSPLFPFRRGA